MLLPACTHAPYFKLPQVLLDLLIPLAAPEKCSCHCCRRGVRHALQPPRKLVSLSLWTRRRLLTCHCLWPQRIEHNATPAPFNRSRVLPQSGSSASKPSRFGCPYLSATRNFGMASVATLCQFLRRHLSAFTFRSHSPINVSTFYPILLSTTFIASLRRPRPR